MNFPRYSILGFAGLLTLGCGAADRTAPQEETPQQPGDPSATAAATDSWIYETTMPAWRIGARTATVSSVVYVIGGGSRTVNAYNPTSKVWSLKKPLPEPLTPNGATVINGKIYVTGGVYGQSVR